MSVFVTSKTFGVEENSILTHIASNTISILIINLLNQTKFCWCNLISSLFSFLVSNLLYCFQVNLLNMLPEMDRTKEQLALILEDRGLNFLFPLLRIQAELWKQLQVSKISLKAARYSNYTNTYVK